MPNKNEIQHHIDAISSFFAQQRIKSKLTQEEVSTETGIGLTSYRRFEEQKRDPRVSELLTLMNFHDITLLDVAVNEIRNRQQKNQLSDIDLLSAINTLPPELKRSLIDFIFEILPHVQRK